jgi:hypothetical protein
MQVPLRLSAVGPLRSLAVGALYRRGLGAAGCRVTSVSPGPVHRSGAPTRLDPGLLLYLRSPCTPPPRACDDRGRSPHAPHRTSFRAEPLRAEGLSSWHHWWFASTANLGGGRLGVVGYGVTGGKGGGPDQVASKRLSGQPARGTRRSPGTPPPRARSHGRPPRPEPLRRRRRSALGARRSALPAASPWVIPPPRGLANAADTRAAS